MIEPVNDDASATVVVYSPTDAESRARLPLWVAAASSTSSVLTAN